MVSIIKNLFIRTQYLNEPLKYVIKKDGTNDKIYIKEGEDPYKVYREIDHRKHLELMKHNPYYELNQQIRILKKNERNERLVREYLKKSNE
jgi:hypothetical protein